MLAILLPLTGYWLVKIYSKDAVHMPRHYFYDSVAVVEKKGKTVTDTAWHHVRNLRMINQFGKQVSLDDAKNKVLLFNFFFTRCPSICPGLTKNMKKLQQSFVKNPEIVQFNQRRPRARQLPGITKIRRPLRCQPRQLVVRYRR